MWFKMRIVENTKVLGISNKASTGSRLVPTLVAGLALAACTPMTPQQEAQVAKSINTVSDGHYRYGYYTQEVPILVTSQESKSQSKGGKAK